jgi:hypothetical protein
LGSAGFAGGVFGSAGFAGLAAGFAGAAGFGGAFAGGACASDRAAIMLAHARTAVAASFALRRLGKIEAIVQV